MSRLPAVVLGDAGQGGALVTGQVRGFFSSAHRLPFSALASSVRPPARSWLTMPRRTWSKASVAYATTGKASRHSTAVGARAATTSWIHWAPSAQTWVSTAPGQRPDHRRTGPESRVWK